MRIRGEQIHNLQINGRHFTVDVGVYNPLISYESGQAVLWKGKIWLVRYGRTIPQGEDENDYANAPDSSKDWIRLEDILFRWYNTVDDIRLIDHQSGVLVGSLDHNAIYRYDESLNEPDDGVNIIKPNDVADGAPGRWVKQDWFAERDKIQSPNGLNYFLASYPNIIKTEANDNGELGIEVLDANDIVMARFFRDSLYFSAVRFINDNPLDQRFATMKPSTHMTVEGWYKDLLYFDARTPYLSVFWDLITFNGTLQSGISNKFIIQNYAQRRALNVEIITQDNPNGYHPVAGDIIIKAGNLTATSFTDSSNVPGRVKIDGGLIVNNTFGEEYNGYISIGNTTNVVVGDDRYPYEKLEVEGTLMSSGRRVNLLSVTADTTLTKSNHYVSVDATAGNIRISMPDTSTGVWNGQQYKIKRIDSSTNTVDISDANGSIYSLASGESIEVVFDSAQNKWIVW